MELCRDPPVPPGTPPSFARERCPFKAPSSSPNGARPASLPWSSWPRPTQGLSTAPAAIRRASPWATLWRRSCGLLRGCTALVRLQLALGQRPVDPAECKPRRPGRGTAGGLAQKF